MEVISNQIKLLQIASRTTGHDQPCFIAAEIGLNHNGDMDLARRSIDAAAASGANGVKFQNYATSDFLLTDKLTYTYWNNGREITESQWKIFERCELTDAQLKELKQHCDRVGVVFFSTPTSEAGVRALENLDCALIKNGSDYLTNLDLIRCMAATGKLTVLSTGMATVAEIEDAVSAFRLAGGQHLILLHCTSSYPTPPDEINLKRIPVLATTFSCPSGFSDHSEGSVAAVGARVLGACFIEKHFTLDKNLPGPDHRFSADPMQFREMVNAVRAIELAMGSSQLGPTTSEAQGRISFRLSCLSAENLAAGTPLQSRHIVYRRPGTGIPPSHSDALLGRLLKRAVSRGHVFTWDDLE